MSSNVIGSRVIDLPSTGSTNAYAMQLLSGERPQEGTVINAFAQSAGRGQGQNQWESEPGKNLTFSVILYPGFLAAEKQFLINEVVSLGISDLIAGYLPDRKITIKWPNDIYIDDRKACGILIQHSVIGNMLDYTVSGIGLNVNQEIFLSDAPNPVSLRNISGTEYQTEKVLKDVLLTLDERYRQLKAGNRGKLHREYLRLLFRFGEWHSYNIRGTLLEARITGLSPYGQLVVHDRNDQPYICDVKEITYL